MSDTLRSGLPYVYVTWLTPLLAGEAQCHYAAHFKARHKYTKRPSTFDLAAWSADHTVLLQTRRAELEADGWRTAVEGINAFRLKGDTAILAGQPDIIASRTGETRVIDLKTGQQRHRDWWQVLVYLAALPKVFGYDRLNGEVCYPTHRITVPNDALTAARADQIWTLVRRLATERCVPVPSATECHFCDLANCDARIEAPVAAAVTSAF